MAADRWHLSSVGLLRCECAFVANRSDRSTGRVPVTKYDATVAAGEDKFTWKDYEEQIYERLMKLAGDHGKVEFNVERIGKFSGVPRQIDVLVTGTFANVTGREMTAAVDCKYYTKNITVDGVDRMIGFIEDVQTDIGIIITNKGFSDGAKQRANRGIDLQVIVADIDRIPPIYHPTSGEAYYASEYWEGIQGRPDGVMIEYVCLDPDALEYSYDPDNPPEWTSEPVLSGTTDEITWSDDEGRATCLRAILRHRAGGGEPLIDDVKDAVRELAYHWEDGFPWTLYVGQLARIGL